MVSPGCPAGSGFAAREQLELVGVWVELFEQLIGLVWKPPANSRIQVAVVAPAQIEQLRAGVPSLRDATLISVIAYAGLRPGEALALTWGDILEQTLLVNKSLSLGETKDTKTRVNRTVSLRPALAQDLREWRLASGRPDSSEPVFPASGGGYWSDHEYRNWRTRVFKPAVARVGIVCDCP
jgi:integrase